MFLLLLATFSLKTRVFNVSVTRVLEPNSAKLVQKRVLFNLNTAKTAKIS